MGTVRTDEFRKDAVRIALTSGLSRKQMTRMVFCERYWGAVADSNVIVTGTLSP